MDTKYTYAHTTAHICRNICGNVHAQMHRVKHEHRSCSSSLPFSPNSNVKAGIGPSSQNQGSPVEPRGRICSNLHFTGREEARTRGTCHTCPTTDVFPLLSNMTSAKNLAAQNPMIPPYSANIQFSKCAPINIIISSINEGQ